MSMSKDIDNLDTAARAAGFAMAGSEESFQFNAPADKSRSEVPAIKADEERSWLRQVSTIKTHFSMGTGWSPWKATA